VVTPAALALEDRIAMQRIAVEELLAGYAAVPQDSMQQETGGK